jgi:6,7-dimethyl-8-ribityllumazine synthase
VLAIVCLLKKTADRSQETEDNGGMKIIEGELTGVTGRFALVAARFNQLIVDRLVDGARDALGRHGVAEDAVDLVWVPGSFELPLLATKLAASSQYAAVICLGCVLQGETDHYDYVCSQAASGVARAALDTGVPVIFGVLTCATLEQAMNRAGGKAGNKGHDAALAALEMASLVAKLHP